MRRAKYKVASSRRFFDKWFIADWVAAMRGLSFGTQGVWMAMLCLMKERMDPPCWTPGDAESVAQMLGCATDEPRRREVIDAIAELEEAGVFSRGRNVDGRFFPDAIVSRRLFDEYLKATGLHEIRAEAGRRGGLISRRGASSKSKQNQANKAKPEAKAEAGASCGTSKAPMTSVPESKQPVKQKSNLSDPDPDPSSVVSLNETRSQEEPFARAGRATTAPRTRIDRTGEPSPVGEVLAGMDLPQMREVPDHRVMQWIEWLVQRADPGIRGQHDRVRRILSHPSGPPHLQKLFSAPGIDEATSPGAYGIALLTTLEKDLGVQESEKDEHVR